MRTCAIAFAVCCSVAASAAPDDLQGRRAVRGSPVETFRESDELRTMREFEESSLARGMAEATSEPLQPWSEQLRLPDIPVRFDAKVVRYLNFYKSDRRGRAIMTSWLKAQGRFRHLIEEALRRARLPLALAYVVMIESGFDPHDRSHKGAVGLWQFMPEGGRIYGLRIDFWVDERKDPERSTEAAVRYLSDLRDRFGSWSLALAAFNAGYGGVLRAMQKYNTNDYWELSRHEDGLPWDTVLYVPKVLAAALVGENRRAFDYQDVPSDAPYTFDRVTVPAATPLAAVARAAEVPLPDVEALNPELRRKRVPPDTTWAVRVPRGVGARVLANLDANVEKVKPYTLRFGEHLEDVARMHGAAVRELKVLNGVDDTADARAGVTIVVPEGRAPQKPTTCEPTIVAVPDKEATVAGRRRVFYRTLAHDTIQDVAAFFRIKSGDLAAWNNLDLEAKLAVNMVLQVWLPREFDLSKVALVDPTMVRVVTTGSAEFFDLVEARRGRVRFTYTVKSGDDLKRIGSKWGLTVADLERINRFGEKHAPLAAGQRVIVYRPMTPKEKEQARACPVEPGGGEEVSEETAPALPRPPPPDRDP